MDIQLPVESGKLRLYCQPHCSEPQEQDVELGGKRRRLFHDLLSGPQHPGLKARTWRRPAPLPTDPTRLTTERVLSRNSSTADRSKPRRCSSPWSAIAPHHRGSIRPVRLRSQVAHRTYRFSRFRRRGWSRGQDLRGGGHPRTAGTPRAKLAIDTTEHQRHQWTRLHQWLTETLRSPHQNRDPGRLTGSGVRDQRQALAGRAMAWSTPLPLHLAAANGMARLGRGFGRRGV